ncbi:MAG TPA: TIGR02281 family clan AA aspartic protease [Gammaproteobacteria bacterium]|nr:TIGR02281 family clan AA aspartic protease [Gammaproteobacteria bacterium]
MKILVGIGLLLALAGTSVFAGNIMVMGLFKQKAVLMIDGKQRTLAVGQTSPEGITLISATSNAAVLEIAGKRGSYPLGNQVGGKFDGPKQTAVQLYPDQQGMYTAVGSINGLPINFMVDTGATFISMNGNEARRLGIDYRLTGQPARTSTASGIEQAYHVKLQRVRVGDIELRDIDALVLDGAFPTEVLLGMSFLGRLEIQHAGKVMELRKKY